MRTKAALSQTIIFVTLAEIIYSGADRQMHESILFGLAGFSADI